MKIIRENNNFKPARLALLIAFSLTGSIQNAMARDYFNPELVELDNPRDGGKADLAAFEVGTQAPGTYHVDVMLNNDLVDTLDIEFRTDSVTKDEGRLEPCLTVEQLKEWGVKTELFPVLAVDNERCADLHAIPAGSTEFQFNAQRLLISMPQAAISRQARGYVPPEQWDEGISAALLNYSLSGANSHSRNANGDSSNTQYANLRPGINIGPWRLRNYATWSRDQHGQNSWDSVYTYAQRAVIPLKALMTLGDSTAPADVFDSMPFRGVQLASDDDMQPDSLKGYAPVVRGIARTNAQVIVRQNGYEIYQTYVAPGAFEITDMYSTGGAGDLEVTIKEADGSIQKFTVPYASLPVLQREGRFKYAITGGQYRSYNSNIFKTPFAQITGIYGFPFGLTAYGGGQASSNYQSLAAGIGKNMGDLGAISVDVIQAWSMPYDALSNNGQSWRARYSKNFIETGTNFAIAGFRYSTKGFYGMQEVLDSYGNTGVMQNRRRNRMELTMNQSLGSLGSIMASAVREDYWNSVHAMESWSLGYNNSWNGISYGLTYTSSRNGAPDAYGTPGRYDKDQMVAVNISVPLDKFLPQTWSNYSLNNSKNNGTTHTIGINGTALENNALNWSVQQGYDSNNSGSSGNLNGDYKGTYGEMTAGYSYDQSNARFNYGVQGGVIAHAEGITLSQPLGETNILITVPGAKGLTIRNQTGAKTDYRGYTTVSNVNVYRRNDIVLDPDSMSNDVELELTTRTVVPTRGAIVRAKYTANVGRRALLTLLQANGQPVPFGAIVSVNEIKNSGFIVGDNGQVYLTGLGEKIELTAQWGETAQNQCKASFVINPSDVKNSIAVVSTLCR